MSVASSAPAGNPWQNLFNVFQDDIYSGSCLSKPQFDRVSESHKTRKKLLMPAPLSIDLRQRIIAAYEAKEGS
jgi:hypothetical protein